MNSPLFQTNPKMDVLRTSNQVFVGADDHKSHKTQEIFNRVLLMLVGIFCIFLLAFVVLIFVRVKTLEDMAEMQGKAAMVQTHNDDPGLLDDNILNSTPTGHHNIWRRDTQDETIEPFYHQPTSGTGLHGSLFDNFIHVVGSRLMHYEQGQYISWYNEEDPSNALSRQNMPFKQDKFIIIPKPGYYYVYAQLTYADNVDPATGVFRIGHEVVREANCGQGQGQPLLSTWITQARNVSASDSTYMGGVFYLYTNDKIGVQIKENGASQAKIANNPRTLNFFGAYTVSANPSFDHRLEDSCCCLNA